MKEVRDEILRYIQNEKDISKYKISTIERRSDISPSKRRILNIEKEFLKLPLEDMSFEDVADVAAAISIYRTSRNQFYQTYKIDPPELYQLSKQQLVSKVQSKIDFILQTGYAHVHTRVQELNLVQNSDFYFDLAKRQSIKNGTSLEVERRELDNLTLMGLNEIEPLTIAKKRARAQAAVYSIGKYLLRSVKGIYVSSEMSLESLKETEEFLDSIVVNINDNIFCYYNEALEILPKTLNGTMGQNSYIEKIHSIQNVLDFESLKDFGDSPVPLTKVASFNSEVPMIGNILYGHKKIFTVSKTKDAERNIQNKVFGILLPIPRKGNEKMSLLYKSIKVDNMDVSHLFTDSISNVKAMRSGKRLYYKALLMHPLWKIIDMANSDDVSRKVLSIIMGLDKKHIQNINFDDKDVVKLLNSRKFDFINISKDSVALTAKTRSEEEGISEIFTIINSKVSEIKEDYALLNSTTNQDH